MKGEKHPANWRQDEDFVAHVKSSVAKPTVDNLSQAEEATLRFGYWCWLGALRKRGPG